MLRARGPAPCVHVALDRASSSSHQPAARARGEEGAVCVYVFCIFLKQQEILFLIKGLLKKQKLFLYSEQKAEMKNAAQLQL